MFNAITARNLGIIKIKVERNSQINKEADTIPPKMKESPLR